MVVHRSKSEPSFLIRLVVMEIENDFPVAQILGPIPDSYNLDMLGFVWGDHELGMIEIVLGE